MQASWVNNTPPVPFKELRAPVAGTRREILPPITSSLLRILFNDNPAQTFVDLRGFIDEIPFTGAIPDDPPIPPEFTVEKLRMNLRGFTLAGGATMQSLYPDVEALFQHPPAVVDRALFVLWTKKVIGWTSNHFREDAAHAPARVGLLGSDADNRILDRVTIKIMLSPPPSPGSVVEGRWAPSSRSGSPSSRGHPSIPPSAAGSPDSAVGDPALAGGRRRRRILLTYRRRYGVNERASVRRKTRRNSRTRVVRSGPSSNPNSRRRS